jgi:hypothetical protein
MRVRKSSIKRIPFQGLTLNTYSWGKTEISASVFICVYLCLNRLCVRG